MALIAILHNNLTLNIAYLIYKGKVMNRTISVITAAMLAFALVGCASTDPVEQERRAVYEQQKKREQADRTQRESDAAVRRMDKTIGK